MSADMKAATEFAQTLTTSGHPDLNETVNLAAAFIELQAELERERKARETAEKQLDEYVPELNEITSQRNIFQIRAESAEQLAQERLEHIVSVDIKAATEIAERNKNANTTFGTLAAAFIELQAELNQERKAREEAERDTTWQDHADYWKKRAESAEARLAETARRKP